MGWRNIKKHGHKQEEKPKVLVDLKIKNHFSSGRGHPKPVNLW